MLYAFLCNGCSPAPGPVETGPQLRWVSINELEKLAFSFCPSQDYQSLPGTARRVHRRLISRRFELLEKDLSAEAQDVTAPNEGGRDRG